MIIKVRRYLGNMRWGKSFDYSIDTQNIDQINNDGIASYRIYRKRGRPTSFFYQQKKEDWEHYSENIWCKGNMFFASNQDRDALWNLGREMKIMTLRQPHARVR